MALSRTTKLVILGAAAVFLGPPLIAVGMATYRGYQAKKAQALAAKAAAPRTYLAQSITGVTPPIKYLPMAYHSK